MYNRYVRDDCGRYSAPDGKHWEGSRQNSPHGDFMHAPPPYQKREYTGLPHFSGDALKSFLPQWLEFGDILLLLLLLFLYIESEDEEFLIMLAVVGYGIFKKR